MLTIIDTPRAAVNDAAPALLQFKVKPDEVRAIIGPGGSVIQEISRENEVKIDINDDGSGVITGKNQEGAKNALALIEGIVWKPQK